MPKTTDFLGQPLLLVSLLAIVGVGGWAYLYLRRHKSPKEASETPPWAAQKGVPVAASAVVAPPPPARLPGENPAVAGITFADVAGLDEAVEELRELKDYLLNPERFRRLGATLPRGVLLVGPPGTGKTLLTKALAEEAGIPFQVVSSSSLVEVYVGVGPARVRQVFAEARKHAPSIILLDELDAIGRTRAQHAAGGQEERESTLNQLLLEMDGFDPSTGVLVVGATNRPDVLDPALLRPGRFDRRLFVNTPDLQGRRAILAVHARNKPLHSGANLDAVARRTTGFTGADLANVMNEAALLSGRRHKDELGAEELDEAIDRTLSGPQRLSQVVSAKDKRVMAYHEAGHAVVAWKLALGYDVHRISIVARGQSHGHTLSVPTEDRLLLTGTELCAQLSVLLAGRVAEEIVFGDSTTGAEDDLARATSLADRMVKDFGMSKTVGLRCVAKSERRDIHGDSADPGVSRRAEDEVGRLIDEANVRAAGIVTDHRDQLDSLAERLIAVETLEKDEIDRLLGGNPKQPMKSSDGGSDANPSVRRRTASRRVLEGARAAAHT